MDLYGGFPDMAAIRAIAEKHGIAVIEDAAQAIGARYHDQAAGSLGDFGVFSFHGSKTLTAGEGGLLLCRNQEHHRRVLTLRDHGREPGGRLFWNSEIGYKYKMSSMQAALAWAQMQRLGELIDRKRCAFGWYRSRLEGLDGITLNAEPNHIFNTYWMTSIVLDPSLGWDKEQLGKALGERGIDTRPFFYPLSSLPAFAGHAETLRAQSQNTNAYSLAPFGLNLPSGLLLSENDIDIVCKKLSRLLRTS